jgi:hypothetical protein
MDLSQLALAALIVALPLLVVALLLYLLRKGRITATTTVGALYDFLPRDRQQAAEVVVEKEAHKKMEEEDESGAPEDPIEERFQDSTGRPEGEEPT